MTPAADDDEAVPVSNGLRDGLEPFIPAYLGGQRWYAGADPPSPESVRVERGRQLWADGDGHRLWHATVAVDGTHYQLLIGERPAGERAEFLHGREPAVLGTVDSALFYDAVLDSEMARVLLQVASDGAESAALTRPLNTEQSNTSLVFDDRLILKVYRRLHAGRNPDVEVTSALAAVGFDHVALPLVTWREDPYDLAFGQQFLAGGSEGWALALTSLRDLYNSPCDDPAQAGGDFGNEARRLGRMTAQMHLALAETLGVVRGPAVRADWNALLDRTVTRLAAAADLAGRNLLVPAAIPLARLRAVTDPGPAIRVHGDFHLGQVMETDSGWYVLDFEGEPARSLAERIAPTSPLKDVSSFLRSLDYASRYVLTERAASETAQLLPLARAWQAHNRQAFLEGYLDVDEIRSLLPGPESAPAVAFAYELDKALYELDYERAHRPDWAQLPLGSINQLLDGTE
jgi:maltokinase